MTATRSPRFGIRPRMLLLLVGVTLLPAALVLTSLHHASRDVLSADAERMLLVQAATLVDTIDNHNEEMLKLASVVAGSPAVVDGLRSQDALSITRHLQAFQGTAGNVASLAVLDARATIVAATSGELVGRNLGQRLDRVFAGNAALPQVRAAILLPGEPMVVVYVAAVRDGDDVIGAALLAVQIEALWHHVHATQPADDGAFVVITDAAGIRIAHSSRDDHIFRPTGPVAEETRERAIRERWFGSRTAAYLDEVVDEPEAWTRATATLPGTSVYRSRSRANDAWNLSVARRLRTTTWTAFVQLPEQAVFGSIDALWKRAIGFGALVVLLGATVAWFLTRATTDRLLDMAQVVEAVIGGDTSRRVARSDADSTEVGTLMRGLNALVEAVSTSKSDLEATVLRRTAELQAANTALAEQRAALVQQARELQGQQDELAKKNDEIANADRMKSSFLATMSHELRTPLNSVLGFTDLVLNDDQTPVDARHRLWLGEVMLSGRHLLQLINDILDVSKIEAGRARLERQVLRCDDVVAEAVELVAAQTQQRQQRVEVVVTTERSVHADPGRLRQILLNLLSNAIEMNPPGATVTVRVDDADGFVRFAIDDQGPGVSAELAPRLFTAFVQGEKRHAAGTGLGLAISRGLVELHGGTIGVERAPGGGARFAFTMPAAEPGSAPSAVVERFEPTPIVQSRSIATVMIVDDNEQNRALLDAMLRHDVEAVGGTLLSFADAPSALDACATVVPSLMLVDLTMAGMDGFALLKRIRSSPRHAGVPMVAVTALAMAGDEQRARIAGFDGYITKPIDRRMVVRMVRERMVQQ
jgi:signal transduction histidine kinase/CheY-like chemotaxis protein